MNQQNIARDRRIRINLAVGFVVVGLATVVSLLAFRDLPDPIWLLVLLAAVGLYFDWSAVEVNDHLFVSTSALVQITAGAAGAAATGAGAAAGAAPPWAFMYSTI